MAMLTAWGALVAASATAAEDPSKMEAVIDKAGPIAGLFVLVLGVAMFFLYRSMSKQMKKVSPSLPMGRDDMQQAEDRKRIAEAIEAGEGEQAS